MQVVHGSCFYPEPNSLIINCKVLVDGTIYPFTARQDDPSTHAIWLEISSGDAGDIAAYAGPEQQPAPSADPADYPLLPWQFKAMVDYLGRDQDIRDQIALIADPLTRAASLSRYLNASSYEFNDPLMQAMRDAVGMSVHDLSIAWMMAKDLRSTPL